MKTPPSVFLALLLAALPAGLRADAGDKIDPKDITVSFVPEKASIILGEPVYVTLIIKNNSAKRVLLSAVDWPDQPLDGYYLLAIDANGHRLPLLSSAFGLRSRHSSNFHCYIPAGGEYTFPVFVPIFVRFDKPGVYTIALCVSGIDGTPLRVLKKNEGIDIPAVHTTRLKVLPADPVKLGGIIDVLGRALIAGSNKSTAKQEQDAQLGAQETGGRKAGDDFGFEKLEAIDDERVIPWFIQASKSRNMQVVTQSLEVLAGFNNDAALDALKAASKTTPSDIQDPTWSDNPQDAAAGKRRSAIYAIDRSPHPGAVALMLTFRDDPDPTIRKSVIDAIATRMPRDQAIPILSEMAKDKDPSVSDFAKLLMKDLDKPRQTNAPPPE